MKPRYIFLWLPFILEGFARSGQYVWSSRS
jgi:hypothetical protein